MLTYADFTNFSNAPLKETDFPMYYNRADEILSLLCGEKWDKDNATCMRATLHQIEHIINVGGLTEWSNGAGSKCVSSHSYSVGSESESVTYIVKNNENENSKSFNGLAISPLAWRILINATILQTVRGVRV